MKTNNKARKNSKKGLFSIGKYEKCKDLYVSEFLRNIKSLRNINPKQIEEAKNLFDAESWYIISQS